MNTSIVGGTKEVRDVAALWVEQGYTVEPNKGGHLTVRDKEGNFVTSLPNSPSDHRWRKNALSLFRRTIRDRGSQEVKEVTEAMVDTKTALEIPQRQVELSQRVFNTLKERGWPTTMNARGQFIAEAMQTGRDMFGVEGSPWGSEGSAQSALTDLLSGKRIVSERGLDVFDYITTAQPDETATVAEAPKQKQEPRGVAKMGRPINYAAPEDIRRAVEQTRAMVNEIDGRNDAEVRKGHIVRFGTMKYAAVWADRTCRRTGYTPTIRNGKDNHSDVASWSTRMRDLFNDTQDASRMTAEIIADVLYVTGQWAKASDQEKWQYLNDGRMGDRHRISAPSGVRQVDQLVDTIPDEVVDEIMADVFPEEVEPIVASVEMPPEPRVDTGSGTPLHMRVLYAIVAGAERPEALELADEVRRLEER